MKRPTVISVRLVTPRDRGIIETLFGARGVCAGCWCMHWRLERGGQLWRAMQGEPNKQAFMKLLAAGSVRAVIAETNGEAVGWCSFGPRIEFPKLERSRVFHRANASPKTWAVICFFIKTGWRGKGIATALLQAATREAVAAGAREIEGLPALHARDKKLAAAFAWTGVPEMFEAVGFCATKSTTGRLLYLKTR
jgi:GNAT superfamily N-acetyltransferase